MSPHDITYLVVSSAWSWPSLRSPFPQRLRMIHGLPCVASFPSPTVSFQWELSERFALRIEGSYSYRDESTESTSGGLADFRAPPAPTTFILEPRTRTESTSSQRLHRRRRHLHDPPQRSVASLRGAARLGRAVQSAESPSEHDVDSNSAGVAAERLPQSVPSTRRFESSSTSPAAGASFGAATNVHRRLALFGEAGFTWSRSDAPARRPSSPAA